MKFTGRFDQTRLAMGRSLREALEQNARTAAELARLLEDAKRPAGSARQRPAKPVKPKIRWIR